MSSLCMHLYVIDEEFSPALLNNRKQSVCHWCSARGENLWLCLYKGCLKVGCGEKDLDHATAHSTNIATHCIAINLFSYKAWCYMCEMEVTSCVLYKLTMNPSRQIHFGNEIKSSGVAVARPVTPNDSSADEDVEGYKPFIESHPKGLVGLRNLGLTCYMNAAIQALSNSIPLCQFMRNCTSFLPDDRKQVELVWPFHQLLNELWIPKGGPSNVAPAVLYHSFRTLYPMFRPFSQQDSQEFLRYFMDRLHEELKEPYFPLNGDSLLHQEDDSLSDDEDMSSVGSVSRENESDQPISSPSDDYETCDSGMSDEKSSVRSSPRRSLQRKRKRRKRHHKSICEDQISRSFEHDHSEFSDAMSDSSLLDAKFLNTKYSTSTSGIGSSKPSISSFSSCLASKSGSSFGRQSGSHLGSEGRGRKVQAVGSVSDGPRKKKKARFRSVISDCFDGVLVSSVQCLTCNRTSSRKETFQDLSLPIPSADQLNMLLQQSSSPSMKLHSNLTASPNSHNFHVTKKSCDVSGDGWLWLWIWSLFGWVKSWLWGLNVSLSNCLSAFFSADELKGDNMYSCEKCGKLRNGIKYSKVVRLPEILIVHLKRFRHDYMFSSKISQYVSFPMQGLDLTSFLHKDCTSDVRSYDLYSVICHHGAVGGGHYTAFALNASNGRWYEFDDHRVTEVSPEIVANCEAYVLFYKKVSPEMLSRRERTVELMRVSSRELLMLKFYVSKQWINKFNTFAEPGPVDNSDFLCPHGGVQPLKAPYVDDLVMTFSQGVWEYLHQVFGGGPACTSLYECVTCREEQEALQLRLRYERETFLRLHRQFQEVEQPGVVYAMSMKWYRAWEAFVLQKQTDPPGPLDNSTICVNKNGLVSLKPGSDYAPISKQMWNFFHGIYGGGPDLFVRYGNGQDDQEDSQSNVSSDFSNTDVAGHPFVLQPTTELFKFKSFSSENLSSDGLDTKFKDLSNQRSLSVGEVIFTPSRDSSPHFPQGPPSEASTKTISSNDDEERSPKVQTRGQLSMRSISSSEEGPILPLGRRSRPRRRKSP